MGNYVNGSSSPNHVTRLLHELGRALPNPGLPATQGVEWSAVLFQLEALLLRLRAGNGAVQNGLLASQHWLEFLPEGYLLTDQNGVIEQANDIATEMLGARKEFLVGKPFPL